MKFAEIKDAVYNWFTTVTGVTAIWSDQEGPRPERPYCSLKIISGPVKPNGTDDLKYVSGDRFALKGDRVYTCSINVYGQDAHDILSTARDSLDSPTVIDSLFKDGISVLDEGDIQDVTLKLETHFETRAQMDFIFQVGNVFETDIGIVEKVELEGDYGAIETNQIVDAT